MMFIFCLLFLFLNIFSSLFGNAALPNIRIRQKSLFGTPLLLIYISCLQFIIKEFIFFKSSIQSFEGRKFDHEIPLGQNAVAT